MAGHYSNFANVSHSDYEFTITFARVDHEVEDDEIPGVVVSRINLVAAVHARADRRAGGHLLEVAHPRGHQEPARVRRRHAAVLLVRSVRYGPVSSLRSAGACATIEYAMQHIDPKLRMLIERAAAEGIGMDDIEHSLIEPANLPREEHDALWLYALGCREAPARKTIPLVAG